MTYTIQDFGPSDVMTTAKEGSRRLKVEDGNSSFYEGRQFRCFKNLSITSGGSYVIRIIVPVNGILQNVSMAVHSGDVTLSTRAGGTEGGTYTETVPTFAKNRMTTTPAYTRQFLLAEGGTQAGGIEIDSFRVNTANSSGQRQSVSAAIDERGVEPGTYYWVFSNASNVTAEVTFSAWWGEHP